MKTYAQPLLYFLAATSGLVTALLSDGTGDAVGLVLIALPLWPLMRALAPRRRAP